MSEPKEFLLTLTLPEIQLAAGAIGKLPWEDANPLLLKVQQQVHAQMPKEAGDPAPKAAAKATKAARPDTAPSDDELLDEPEPPALPRSSRRVQDDPDPLPRRRPNLNGRGASPDLAAEVDEPA